MSSTIDFGSGSLIVSLLTNYIETARLSNDKFVVAYTDGNGTCKIGEVGEPTIAFGPENEMRSNGSLNIGSVASISESGFICAYRDTLDSNRGMIRLGTVSGVTITSYGAREIYTATSTGYNKIGVMSSDKFIVAYSDEADSTYGKVKVGSISGGSITYGSEVIFYDDEEVAFISVAVLDDSRFVIAYQNGASTKYGRARIGTVSGTTVTFGDEAIFLSEDSADEIVVTALSANKFVVGYQDASDNRHGTVKVGTVDGTDITFGAESEFLAANGAYWLAIDAINSSSFVIAYQDNADVNHGTAKIGSVVDTTVTFGNESEFLSADAATFVSTSVLSETSLVVAYRDNSNNNYGTANAGSMPLISSETGSGNLYIQGMIQYATPSGSTPDLFTNGYGPVTDSCNLVVGGQNDVQTSGNLFIYGMPSNSIDLFIDGFRNETISGDLYIEGHYPVFTSGDLFLGVHDNVITSTDLFIHGLSEDVIPGNLYIKGKENITDSSNLFIMSPLPETASGDLFLHGFNDLSGSMTLFTYSPPPDIYKSILLYLKVPEPSNASGDFYLHGPEQALASGNLFIVGPLLTSTSGDFFMHGPESISTSGNLFMRGAVESLAESIDWLLRTHDHYPQILGTFESAVSVNIQLWDITDGQNTLVSVASSGCYQIGNTGRWGWSTANIPITQGNGKQYFYLMTSNASITFGGQFFLELPEGAKWIHPSNSTDYLKQI